MAQKDRSQWSEAYRRRVERAEAQGKSRQQARGHKTGEHKGRAGKEILKTGISSQQKTAIKKFVDQQHYRAEGEFDKAEARKEMEDLVKAEGYQAFVNVRETVNAMHKQYVRDYKRSRGNYQGRGHDYVEHVAREHKLIYGYWFFYH